MSLPTTVEEFIAQSEAVKETENYRGDFVSFGIGFAKIDQNTGKPKDIEYIRVNDQDSGAGGTYNHIWIHLGDQLVKKGYALPSRQQIKDLQNTFNPFRDDGKSHPNIDALDQLSDARDGLSSVITVSFL